MELLDYLGYVGALTIGIVLGLIGGGGSNLTVPVLVYFLAVNPVTATAYSLFVAGASSLVGAINSLKKKLVDFRTAAVFLFQPSLRCMLPADSLFLPFLNIFLPSGIRGHKGRGDHAFLRGNHAPCCALHD